MADLLRCTFSLNRQKTSLLVCGSESYIAFSGLSKDVNDPDKTNDADSGPIPIGTYYITGRPSGGSHPYLSALLHDLISNSDRSQWFALFSTTTAQDFMMVKGVTRGNFRLHPEGRLGISEGCITLVNQADFDRLAKRLRDQQPALISNTGTPYYGIVEVN